MPFYGLGLSSLLIWLIHHSDAAKWVLSRGQINVTSKMELNESCLFLKVPASDILLYHQKRLIE